MRTLLLAFGLFFVIALPAFADKGFSTDEACEQVETDRGVPPDSDRISLNYNSFTVCGAMIDGRLEVGTVGPSGCSVGAPGTPIMYRTFSEEKVREFFGLALAEMNHTSKDPSYSFWTAVQDAIAAEFKTAAIAFSEDVCEGGEPAPGTCGTEDTTIKCCQMDPGNGSGSGSNGGESGDFEPQVASGEIGGDPRNNNGGLGGGGGLPGGSSGGASGGGSGEVSDPRLIDLVFIKDNEGQVSSFFLDKTKEASGTEGNPFGVCTPNSFDSAVPGANFTLGALKNEGCPPEHEWTAYGDFMGDMAVAGLALAIPAGTIGTIITTVGGSPVIPIVVVGGAVVVGGYFLYQWWTSESAQELFTMVTVSCQNLCVVADAARAAAIEVTIGTNLRLDAKLLQEVQENLIKEADRFEGIKGPICCQLLCDAAQAMQPWEEACYNDCLKTCAPFSLKPLPCLRDGNSCEVVGMWLGAGLCNTH